MVDNNMHYMARLKGHYFSNPEEIKSLGYTIFVAAVILSFDKWGEGTFNAVTGAGNLLAALIICAVSILIHDGAHRAAAIKMGYSIEHKIWFSGLIASLAIVIASRGYIKLFLFESMILTPVRLHRIGRYPYMGTTWEYGIAYWSGPIASLLIAGLLATISAATGMSGSIIGMAIQFNIIYGILTLLPLPPLDGVWVLYYSRGVYTGIVTGAISYILMTQFGLTGIGPLLLAAIIGIGSGIYWMRVHE